MTDWAIVVGINEYPADAKIKNLNGAVADAAEFASWLLHPQGGQVQPQHLFFWTCPAPVTPPANISAFMAAPTNWPHVGPVFTRPPAAGELMRELATIVANAVGAGARRLYVYFAGHGVQTTPDDYEQEPQNCFVAGDYVPDMPALGLFPLESTRRFLSSQGPPEVIIFSDCCRQPLPLKVPKPAATYNQFQPNGNFERIGIGRAAQGAALAYEVPHDAPARGAFTQLLVNGLRELRVNGQLRIEDLDQYVTTGLVELVKPYSQTPDFEEKPKPPQLVITNSPSFGNNLPVNIEVTKIAAGTQVEVVDSQAQHILSFIAGPGAVTLHLPIDMYSLETQAGDELATFQHLGPGATNVSI